MGRRKRKKFSSTLVGKSTAGFFRLVTQGIIKAVPLLLLGLLGGALFWGIRQALWADPGFLIEKIKVEPEDGLVPDKVRGLEKKYLGESLFEVPVGEISRELEGDPTVRRAEVVREFPKTLRVEIEEREQAMQVRFNHGGPYGILSQDFVVLDGSPVQRPGLLRVEVSGSRPGSFREGFQVKIPGLEEGTRFLEAFREHPVGAMETVSEIRLDHLGGVSLALENGPELRFGRYPFSRAGILDSLLPLLRGPERPQIQYIDVQYQDIVVRKKP